MFRRSSRSTRKPATWTTSRGCAALRRPDWISARRSRERRCCDHGRRYRGTAAHPLERPARPALGRFSRGTDRLLAHRPRVLWPDSRGLRTSQRIPAALLARPRWILSDTEPRPGTQSRWRRNRSLAALGLARGHSLPLDASQARPVLHRGTAVPRRRPSPSHRPSARWPEASPWPGWVGKGCF